MLFSYLIGNRTCHLRYGASYNLDYKTSLLWIKFNRNDNIHKNSPTFPKHALIITAFCQVADPLNLRREETSTWKTCHHHIAGQQLVNEVFCCFSLLSETPSWSSWPLFDCVDEVHKFWPYLKAQQFNQNSTKFSRSWRCMHYIANYTTFDCPLVATSRYRTKQNSIGCYRIKRKNFRITKTGESKQRRSSNGRNRMEKSILLNRISSTLNQAL